MQISELPREELERLAGVMKAVAHADRLRILCRLKDGRRSVSELEAFLKIPQALVSQQLRILRLNGLVAARRKNGFVFYSIIPDKKKYLMKIMSGLCKC